jgi:hypothetical protein
MSTTKLDRNAYESDTEWLADKLFHIENRLDRIEADQAAPQEITKMKRALASSVQSEKRRLVPADEFDGEGYGDGLEGDPFFGDREPISMPTETLDMARDGYFSYVQLGGGPEDERPLNVLRWTPGIERIFPTFDQMAEAKSNFMRAEAWDFTGLAKDGAYIYGIPVHLA